MRGAQAKRCDLARVRHPRVWSHVSFPLTFLSTHLRSCARSLSGNVFGLRGERALANGLKGNSSLRNLMYAAPVARTGRGPVRFLSSAPIGWHASARLCSHARSLSLDKLGPGGGSALAECLSGSSIKIQEGCDAESD